MIKLIDIDTSDSKLINLQKNPELIATLKTKINNDKYLLKLFANYNYVCNFDNPKWLLINFDLFEKYFESKAKLCKKNFQQSKCQQNIPGLQFEIIIKDNKLSLGSKECNCVMYKRIQNNYWYHDFSQDKLKWTFNLPKYKRSNNREEMLHYFISTISKYENLSFQSSKIKGAFIFGDPGLGKTYSSILLANKIATKNKSVLFISTTKLVYLLKESFSKQNNEKTHWLKKCLNVDALFLDDIGGEVITNWWRDEILFTILNDRLLQNKFTSFTSNYSIIQLEKIYSNARNNPNFNSSNVDYSIEVIKAKRLIRRICELVDNKIIKL